MATKDLQSQLGLGLAQAQTAVQNAQAYNTANANQAGRVQIEGGTGVGSSGSIGSQALSPASTSTAQQTSASIASPSIASSPSIATPSGGGIIANNSASGSTAPGSAPSGLKTETVKNYTAPISEIAPQLPIVPTQAPTVATTEVKPMSLIQIRDKIKSENPTFSSFQATQEARKQFDVQNSVIGKPLMPTQAKTGITPLDNELAKLREEKANKIKETYKNYALNQADYQKNAGYYTNFGATNDKFNKVLGDIQNTLTNSNQPTLSDQQMQYIAAKNGVTVDEIKNPLNIYKNLEMTEEGKQTLGVTNRENQMKDLQTANDRAKEDAKTTLDRNTQQLNYQVEDAQKTLRRNIDWATASGAWSGAGKSSGYEQGMDNIKNDTATVINRINQNIDNLNTDNAQYLTRLQDDFTKNMTRSKDSLDMDLKNMKFDTGLKLNGLEEKYGKNSKDLLKALDSIQEEFGTKSLDSFNKYLTSVKSIQGITMDNINLMDKMNTVNMALKNRRYGELTANNGALLQNISLTNIADEVKAGHMDMGKYADVRNLMLTTVTTALQKSGKEVTQDDLNVITNLIDNGATPAQAIARIGGGIKTGVSIDPTNIADYSTQKRGRTNLQCGELTNDYWQQATGKSISNDPSINTYKGKVDAVKKIGESPIPVVGGVFVMNTGTSAGHIGIVQQVNPDGSIVVLEANRSGSTSGGAPSLGNYSAETARGMTFSQPPTNKITQGEATVTPGTKGTRPDRNHSPGNVKAYGNDVLSIPGAVGVDDQNHIIFSNDTDGYNWMIRDLTAKLTGNSSQVSKLTGQPIGPNSTLADLASVYAEDPNWVNNVSQISGYAPDAKLSTIDVNKLGPAVARAEGFSGTIKAGATTTATGKVYTQDQKNLMDLMGKDVNKDEYAKLAKAGINPTDLANYRATPKEITTNLSPLTSAAYTSKSLSGTPTQQSATLEELQTKGLLDKGEGNANFYKAKSDVKQEMPNFLTAYDSFNKAKSIIATHKDAGDLNEMLGSYDAWQERTKNGYTPSMLRDTKFGTDFATLDNIFGKELSQYMQRISGATVGDAEVERLKRQVPNLDMNETQFDSAMSQYEDSLRNANRYFMNEYGFKDIDTAKKVLLGDNSQTQNNTTTPVQKTTNGATVDSIYDEIINL